MRFFAPLLETRLRRAAVVITIVLAGLGALGGWAQGATSFWSIAASAQLLLSVSLPFLGAGLGHAAGRRTGSEHRVVAAAVLAAVVAALVGAALAGAVTLVISGSWTSWPSVLATSVAVQVLAQLTGTGLGLLLPRTWIAAVLTIVAPLAAYLLLTGSPLQPWLTPYGAFQAVFAPGATARDWAGWSVVFVTWGIGLNLTGWAVSSRRRRSAQ